MNAIPKQVLRETEVITSLEQICQALELSPAQFELAKGRYEAVGDWLASADDAILRSVIIYAHGSTAIGTTVKPYGQDEHDVDLMSRVTAAAASTSPSFLKQLIGNRLRANGYYAPILEEKRRCWRINYANEFHLDITPSIRNPNCVNGGELVPDKALQGWKVTNPKGYKSLFDKRALLLPQFRLSKGLFEYSADAAVEPFPTQTTLKGVLRRIVQILKRHRDVHFDRINPQLAPISIVLTTLAARSYERCVTQNVYDTELQLVLDVIRGMPLFIETGSLNGTVRWAVWNETTEGENFADKWNENSALVPAFYQWHKKVLDDMTLLSDVYGLDQLAKSLTESFGSRPVTAAMNARTGTVSSARATGRLSVAPAVGLSVASGPGTPVRANTFFGAD
jgi:hypothetical protein